MKIVGNTVGTSLPKPDLRQTDPRKGDFVHGKDEITKTVTDYMKENPVEAAETYVVTAVKDTEHNETRIDRTNADIFAAHEHGKAVVCYLNHDGMQFLLQPIAINVGVAAFACLMRNASIGVMLVNDELEITEMEFSTTEDLNTAVNTALEQAKESGLFDGKPGADGKDGKDGQDGQNGKDGADGYTPVKGTDYFTPADVQEIAEQAAEMVDVPTGGGEKWEHIGDFNVGDSDVESWTITEDADGKPIELKHLYFRITVEPSAEANDNANLDIGNPANELPFATNATYCSIPAGVRKTRCSNDVWADYIPRGSGFEILAHFSPSVLGVTWQRGIDVRMKKQCIAGLAVRSGNIANGMIGAGSTVSIWGVRI